MTAGDRFRVVAVWAIGWVGTWAHVRGWSPVVVFPSIANEGVFTVALVTGAMAYGFWVATRRRSAPVAAATAAIGVAAAVAGTANDIGRSGGAVASAASIAAAAALLLPRTRPDGATARVGFVLVVASQVWWALDDRVIGPVVLVATSVTASLLHHRSRLPAPSAEPAPDASAHPA